MTLLSFLHYIVKRLGEVWGEIFIEIGAFS